MASCALERQALDVPFLDSLRDGLVRVVHVEPADGVKELDRGGQPLRKVSELPQRAENKDGHDQRPVAGAQQPRVVDDTETGLLGAADLELERGLRAEGFAGVLFVVLLDERVLEHEHSGLEELANVDRGDERRGCARRHNDDRHWELFAPLRAGASSGGAPTCRP
eukprot:Amastigsp_a682633_11.p4 type:complete len:166 gc:universal Amastigsp_a682633_11:174-671(+)